MATQNPSTNTQKIKDELHSTLQKYKLFKTSREIIEQLLIKEDAKYFDEVQNHIKRLIDTTPKTREFINFLYNCKLGPSESNEQDLIYRFALPLSGRAFNGTLDLRWYSKKFTEKDYKQFLKTIVYIGSCVGLTVNGKYKIFSDGTYHEEFVTFNITM